MTIVVEFPNMRGTDRQVVLQRVPSRLRREELARARPVDDLLLGDRRSGAPSGKEHRVREVIEEPRGHVAGSQALQRRIPVVAVQNHVEVVGDPDWLGQYPFDPEFLGESLHIFEVDLFVRVQAPNWEERVPRTHYPVDLPSRPRNRSSARRT